MGGLVDAREMDHHRPRFYRHHGHSRSSRWRDKPHRPAAGGGAGAARNAMATSDLGPADRDLVSGEGNIQLRKETDGLKGSSDSSYSIGSPIEENSFTLEFRQRSCKKATGSTIKALINEEMSRETEVRQPSPSVIARLMGLDTLPPSKVCNKQQKESRSSFSKTSSVGSQGGYISDEDHSLRTSTSELQEFKDVFEVVESSKAEKHRSQAVRKGMACSKQSEKDLDFIRQKFMDAKRLSTSETLQNSKELNDTLEILDSNKELFLKFLQEPNSLFAKHLHDLKCFPPSPQASQITILKSSNGTKYGRSEVCTKAERKAERYAHMQKDISTFRKHTTSHVSHSLKEVDNSRSHKLLKSQYTSKADSCLHPTRIVVLKPGLDKVQGTSRNVSLPRSAENLRFGFGSHREFQVSEIQESPEEGRRRHRLFDNPEVMRHKTKCSREIAREITEQMRLRHIRDESLCIVSGMSRLNNCGSYRQISDDFDDWNSSYHPSSSYSSESSVSKEARKRLSERWKMTNRLQEGEISGRDSGTLGEMLARSDADTPRASFDSIIAEKASDEKSASDEALAAHGFPLGISSRDGWRDRSFINLPRSVSLPASSTVHGTPKASNRHGNGGNDNCYKLKDVLNFGANDILRQNFNRRRLSRRSFKCHSEKPRSLNSVGEENKLPIREIYVNLEERRNWIHENNVTEGKKPFLSELSTKTIPDAGHLVEDSFLQESMDVKLRCLSNQEQVQQSVKDVESSVSNGISIEETSCGHLEEDILSFHCERTESESPASSKEAEQPSPVSVLEPPSKEETCSSGCFERISADLQELRMQLQLLKLESEDAYADEPEVLSDEDSGGDHHSLLQMGGIEQAFKDDNERDFSYILDTLVGSGIHSAKHDRIFDACYLPEHPVDPAVFDKLEEKYAVLVAWPRSERKLLFDHINSILAEILAPCMDLYPWVKSKRELGFMSSPHEQLAEEVWRIVVRQSKELRRGNPEGKVLDPRCIELGNDIEMVGRQIARMLKEDLLEELISEFVSW